jgi:hypothetical protein
MPLCLPTKSSGSNDTTAAVCRRPVNCSNVLIIYFFIIIIWMSWDMLELETTEHAWDLITGDIQECLGLGKIPGTS